MWKVGFFLASVLLSVFAILYPTNIDNNAAMSANSQSGVVAGISTEKVTESTDLVKAINKARQARGLSSVSEVDSLMQVAESRAADMVVREYYAHTTPDGKNFVDDIEDVGISRKSPACENLLMSETKDAEEQVAEWLASDSHRDCLLGENYKSAGVAILPYAYDSNGALVASIVVSIFATPR